MADVLKQRIYSVDLLRGIVMMIMMLDHTRDYIHAGAFQSDPTDLATTTVPVFLTRWITHYCAPTFVFLSGVSIYLQGLNGKSTRELSWFLFTRGLWLVVLEFTLIRLLMVFNLDYSYFGMAQVIWVIGVSMVCMAALVWLPVKLVGLAGLLMIFVHNAFDGLAVPPQVAFAGQPPPDVLQTIAIFLHQPGIIPLFGGASQLFAAYPLIPWVGVMMAGYALGSIYEAKTGARAKLLIGVGVVATLLFLLLRLANVYGDPVAWTQQADAVRTFLSYLNVTKYPPSLLFLLMTLGPALIVLGLADRIEGRSLAERVAINFGRVPLFFYMLQWIYPHSAAVLLSLMTGKDSSYLFAGLFEMGQRAPEGHGFSLAIVYIVWLVGLVVLYPLCVWYGELKRRNKHWALSYL